jgi:hypothetical protein
VHSDITPKTWRYSGRARGLLSITVGVAFAFGLTGSVLAHAEHGHPTRIHEGTCEAIGPVAFSLNGVSASVDLDNAPIATPTAVNADSAYQVMVGETTIDGTIDDLLAGEHAVMVYESDEAMDAIACGNLGGAMVGDSLVTGLAESGHPGHLGFAIFEPNGQQTDITVIIGHALAPVTASGSAADQEHAEGEAEHSHEEGATPEEESHDAEATPDH